mgnify:CR=1 FL=1
MMKTKTTDTVLMVRVYNGDQTIEYKQVAPDFADAEYHIDAYKEIFDGRVDRGALRKDAYATLSWVKDSNNFILDSWNMGEDC